MKTTAIIVMFGMLEIGCATTYRPQEPGRVSFVLDGPGFSLYKNGQTYSALGLSSGPIRAVEGNQVAEDHARIFVHRSRIAWILYGIGLAALGTAIGLNPNGHAHGGQRDASVILGISGVTTVLAGATLFMTAPSHLYDAVNIYNDGQAWSRR